MRKWIKLTFSRIGLYFLFLLMYSRFGAASTLQSMTEEEKMYKKMEIQRKKALKKQRFALGDENEEELLTHKGETIDGKRKKN